MTALLVLCLVAARYLLPRPFAWAARSPATLFLWSLAWCLALVAGAHLMSLSAEIGAFLAGLSVAQLGCSHDLRRRVHPLMSFFIVVFFVSLGAQMQLETAGIYWKEALVLSLFVLLGNPFIFMAIIARYGYSERTCFYTSVTVAQISEFSFIFAALGVSAGLIEPPILALVAMVGLVTIAASAYMILYNRQLYAAVARTGVLRVFRAKQGDDEEPPPERMSGHVVVVGMNDLGRGIATALHERGIAVLAIDVDPRKLAGLSCRTKVGNVEYPSMLEDAGLRDAVLAVSTLRIEATNKLFAFRCKRLGIPVAVHAFDGSVIEDLRAVGPDHLIVSKALGGERMALELERLGMLAP